MKVIILAAGYGTRLYPLIVDTPKALLEVCGKTLIDHIYDKVTNIARVNEILVVTNDKFYPHLMQWAQAKKNPKQTITIVNDGTKTPEDRLGSIGDINFVLQSKKVADDVLVVGSDNLFDYGLDDYCQFSQGRLTLGLYDIGDKSQATKYGVVAIDAKAKVVSFEEKPAQPKSSLIAMCLYYFPQATLPLVNQYLVETKKSDKAGEYIKWLSEKNNVFGFNFSGRWYDIGSIESYQQAQQDFKS